MPEFSSRPRPYRTGVLLLLASTAVFTVVHLCPFFATGSTRRGYVGNSVTVDFQEGLWVVCIFTDTQLTFFGRKTEYACTVNGLAEFPAWFHVARALTTLGNISLDIACIYAIVINWCRKEPGPRMRFVEIFTAAGGLLAFLGCVVYVSFRNKKEKESDEDIFGKYVDDYYSNVDWQFSWAFYLVIIISILALAVAAIIAVFNPAVPVNMPAAGADLEMEEQQRRPEVAAGQQISGTSPIAQTNNQWSALHGQPDHGSAVDGGYYGSPQITGSGQQGNLQIAGSGQQIGQQITGSGQQIGQQMTGSGQQIAQQMTGSGQQIAQQMSGTGLQSCQHLVGGVGSQNSQAKVDNGEHHGQEESAVSGGQNGQQTVDHNQNPTAQWSALHGQPDHGSAVDVGHHGSPQITGSGHQVNLQIAGSGQQIGQQITDSGQQIGQQITDSRQQISQQITDSGQQIGQQITDSGQEIGQQITDSGQQIGQQITDSGQQIGQQITDSGQQIGQQITDSGQQIGQQIASSGQYIGRQMSGSGQQIGQQMTGSGQQIGQQMTGSGQYIGRQMSGSGHQIAQQMSGTGLQSCQHLVGGVGSQNSQAKVDNGEHHGQEESAVSGGQNGQQTVDLNQNPTAQSGQHQIPAKEDCSTDL